jgi:hypothetical protein
LKLYEFLNLNDQLQYQTVWDLGKHVESITQKGVIHLLYIINDFYIEVKYDQRSNQIIDKKAFKQGSILDKYLKKLPTEL